MAAIQLQERSVQQLLITESHSRTKQHILLISSGRGSTDTLIFCIFWGPNLKVQAYDPAISFKCKFSLSRLSRGQKWTFPTSSQEEATPGMPVVPPLGAARLSWEGASPKLQPQLAAENQTSEGSLLQGTAPEREEASCFLREHLQRQA